MADPGREISGWDAVNKRWINGAYGLIGGDSSTVSIQTVLGGTEKVERPYWQDPWIHALVSRRADMMASARLRIYSDRSPDAEPVDDDDALYAFFRRPHPDLSYGRWIRLLATWDCLWGDLVLALRTGDLDDWVTSPPANFERLVNESDRRNRLQLWPIKPTSIELIFTEQMLRDHWLYQDQYRADIKIPLEAVVHIFQQDPYNPMFSRGVGPVAAALRTINLDWQAERFSEADMRSAGAPNTVIKSKSKMTPEQKAELAQQYQEKHAKPENQGRPIVVDRETELEFPGHSAKEMAWLDLRTWNRDTKVAVVGLNKAMLGLTDDDTRANAQEGRRNAWQDTLLPALERLAAEFENELLPKLPAPWNEYGIKFDTSHIDALKDDETETWANAKVIFDTFPGQTLESVATLLDIDIPDGVPATETKPEPEPASPPGAGRAPALKAMVDVMEFPTFRRIASEQFAASLDQFERVAKKRTASVMRGYLKKCARLAAELAEKAGAPVVARDFSPGDFSELMPDVESWKALLADQLAPLERKLYLLQGRLIADAAGAEALSTIGADPYAIQFLANKEIRLKETMETLREDVRQTIAKALLEDGDMGTLADQIRNALERYETDLEVMRDGLSTRAERIARTEGTSIANAARMQEAKLQGIQEMRWISARDAAVRHEHAELDGRVRTVGEEFGYGLKYPGDSDAGASMVVNCRCSVTPTARGVGVERALNLNRWHKAMYSHA